MEISAEVIVSSATTAAKFEEFRQNDLFCDVTLYSGSAAVKAHRVLLAASSPYFEENFKVGLKESQKVLMNLPSIHPDALPLLVDFIYTGRTTIDQSTAPQLMEAAHMLQLQDLVTSCAGYLKSHLAPSKALSTFRLAEVLGHSELAEHALVYAGKHWAEVKQNQELLDLPLQDFRRILSSDKFVVNNELDVVVSVVRWLEHDPAVRVHCCSELFPLLRLRHLPTKVLDDVRKNVKDTQLANILNIFSMGMQVVRADTRQHGHSTLYVVGGFVDDKAVSTVLKYDIHKKVWEVIAPMATARGRLDVAVLDGRLYAVGGYNEGPVASCEVYDPTTNKWSPIAAVNTARWRLALAALGGKLYAFGGDTAAGALASVEVYDPRTDTWTVAGDMPHGRTNMSVVVYENAVYLTGGKSPTGDRTTVLRYEVTAGSGGEWHFCAPMSCGRDRHATVVLGGHLYVIGGSDENDVSLNTVARYDFVTDLWEDVAPLNEHRRLCMAGAIGNQLLVAGGFTSKSCAEVYEVGENRWLTSPPMPHSLWGAGYASM